MVILENLWNFKKMRKEGLRNFFRINSYIETQVIRLGYSYKF